ncbi:MAG TPA: hypothetical protein VN654_10440 [Vicinamibacterales bacterium]|jgi:hypothetical protein|nr:hypothetical protein [Vicinamibacterales bacterium]
MSKAQPAADGRQQPASASRLLDSNTGIPGDADQWPTVYPECESCHWAVVETRFFKGRELCLSCIAEYFSGETDEP